ncbi:beta-N-acetylglucosaminidase domain-containing protein [Labedaea rhizosphaerae]|uniref:Hyaluronoglucosaminidase n=1 Tax=Labedaea rhizosphaerae TaxID=598644 RepID=A0A4R6SIB7_LABRH|nr:beta-N-acetylglucosaminidase domain-containing protein [Labedaea rhizosphaerae]TDQ01136.1 hyaluronoglucosaminidase [Labedaea rhizosphaerae]
MRIQLAAVVAGLATIALGAPVADAAPAATPQALPPVSPTPQQISRDGADVQVPSTVTVVTDSATDKPALDLLTTQLRAHGVHKVVTDNDNHGGLVIRLGGPEIASVPTQAEGYTLRVDRDEVVIAGRDGAGQYYGVQTLRQLFVRSGQSWKLAGASVQDWPNMALRGSIEGFYGPPWTTADRVRQLEFLGSVKANTYVYSAKDDAYLRARWRDAYPADQLATLGTLAQAATANHVEFTYALSPGVSICFSSPADRAAVFAKFQSVYDLGVRSFSMPFDDISYTRWNCAADQTAYGAPGRSAAGAAQVSLLNDIAQNFIATHPGTKPLQTVPTEYSDLADSAYKTQLREHLDPSVVVQWTGTDVVPPSITTGQADQVSTVYGRKVFLWDNYPVNDYGQSGGRLLLAPYDKRQAGLSDYLSGIVSNPMNQEAASEVAEFGVADFAWNDKAYSAAKSWPLALAHLTDGDQRAVDAMLVFADLEHLAPTFGTTPWQPQAPALAARVDAFWQRWNAGDHAGAATELRAYAQRIADAPGVIRDGAVSPAFVTDAGPWLDATALWGAALVDQLDALVAADNGDQQQARQLTASADALVAQAKATKTGNTNRWGIRQALVGDGVLDVFITQARELTAP